jgi:NAD(P)-dependent dehydrogenase (short-subunit alcohol dehydrogenase family)
VQQERLDPLQRVALVTGANRGLGLEIVTQLARLGLLVVPTARDADSAAAVAHALTASGLRAVPGVLDVTSDASVGALQTAVLGQLGRVDVLVNNAGIGHDFGRPAAGADLALVEDHLRTNLLGSWRVSNAFVGGMVANHYGRIVFLSSGLGALSEMGGGSPGYRASKAGVNALVRMLAAETAGANVLVNAACPGWVRTDMGGPNATRTVPEGADTAVWLATLEDGGPTGGFFRDRAPIAF